MCPDLGTYTQYFLFTFFSLSVLVQADFAKAKDEVTKAKDDAAKVKEDLAKAKEDVQALKQQAQAKVKAMKEEEKAKAKATAHLANLQRENERLTTEVSTLSRDLKRQQARAQSLEQDILDLKQDLELAKTSAKSIARKPRARDDDDDDDDDDNLALSQSATGRKRLKLNSGAQASPSSLAATIEQQVAECIKRLIPAAGASASEVHPPPPPRQLFSFGPSDTPTALPRYKPQSSPSSFRPYEGSPYPSVPAAPTPQTVAPIASSSAWPASRTTVSPDTPLGAALSAAPIRSSFVAPTADHPLSPVVEPEPELDPEAEMFKQFQAFMKAQKKAK